MVKFLKRVFRKKSDLTDKQLLDYSEASLYIFNGLSSEKDDVVPLFNNNKNLKIINIQIGHHMRNMHQKTNIILL